MKTVLLIALLSFAGTVAVAQSCKFNYDKVDPFTNEREQRIIFAPAFNQYFSMAFYHKGADYRIESYINMPGKQEFEIPAGSKLDIKLGNGKLITLGSTAKTMPAVYLGSDQVMTSYSISYTITKEQYQEIAANGIALMRTWLHEKQYYDHEYKKAEMEKTKIGAACIIGN